MPPRLRLWSTASRSRRRRLAGHAASMPPTKSRAASAMSPLIRSACRSHAKSRLPHAGPRRAGARLARSSPLQLVRDDEFVDSSYNGVEAQLAAFEASRISVTVAKRDDKQIKGFIVLPSRWVVERPFGWISRARRLAEDFAAIDTSPRSHGCLDRPRLRCSRAASPARQQK